MLVSAVDSNKNTPALYDIYRSKRALFDLAGLLNHGLKRTIKNIEI